MNILTKPEQAVVPVNQPHPNQFPRFYLISETKYIPRRHRASNAALHNQSSPKHTKLKQESRLEKFIRHEKEICLEVCRDTWAALKDLGRAITRWIARWVVTPLALSSSLYIPAIHPMDLPF
jgi:hypothetical protein